MSDVRRAVTTNVTYTSAWHPENQTSLMVHLSIVSGRSLLSWCAFISWKYSGINLTRRSSRASACRKWEAFVTDAEVETKTSPLMRPTEDTVSLVNVRLWYFRTQELVVPGPNKMDPHIAPAICPFEFCCRFPRLRFVRVDRPVMSKCPVGKSRGEPHSECRKSY